MQQVFTNLFSNALKYSPDNSSVEVKLSLEDNEHFHLVMKDYGIGIDKAEQRKYSNLSMRWAVQTVTAPIFRNSWAAGPASACRL